MTLRAPFPWFGGKSRAASLVWRAFGDVPNYVEPFAGSLAVLLARPTEPGTETVNDLDCYLANFWRAVAADPAEVAEHADWPVNEADLHARHLSLVRDDGFRERMKTEPDFYDARVAGWWVWGLCSWIGSGWCAPRERGDGRPSQQLPHLGNAGMGVHRKLPHLGDAGRGVFDLLAARLRRVRVACGDWTRVLGESVTIKHGVTGVLLDPPYSEGADDLYSTHDKSLSADVRAWALENGSNPLLRIALCGYEGEHDMPGWQVVEWKAKGGYGSQAADGNENSARERIWFSPACARAKAQSDLFAPEAA
jgi:DNA adenine methylase